jgi:hypothetical protein
MGGLPSMRIFIWQKPQPRLTSQRMLQGISPIQHWEGWVYPKPSFM